MNFNEKNVMLDLETLSTESNALILSIGAAVIDLEESVVRETFYANIEYDDISSYGFHIKPSTVMWWLKQSDAARSRLLKDQVSIYDALHEFENFLPENADIWGNGSDFDNVILANAYKNLNLDVPWSFRQNRCYRTFKKSFPNIVEPDFYGVEHDALADALNQAIGLIRIHDHLKGKL